MKEVEIKLNEENLKAAMSACMSILDGFSRFNVERDNATIALEDLYEKFKEAWNRMHGN